MAETETARLVLEGGYADWADLIQNVVIEKQENANLVEKHNQAMMSGAVKYRPYVSIFLSEGVVLDTLILDVSKFPLWGGWADSVLVAEVAFYKSSSVAFVLLEAYKGDAEMPIIPFLYGNNNNQFALSSNYDALVGRLITFRIINNMPMSAEHTAGYISRLETVKNDPNWDFFYKTQVLDRTPEATALFEHIATADESYPFQRSLYWVKNSPENIPADEGANGLSRDFGLMACDFPIMLADMIGDETSTTVWLEDGS